MKPSRETLASQKADYEEKLRGLKGYARELKATAEKHGTDCAVYEHGLSKAAHDSAFYEAELQRICGELADADDDIRYHVFKDSAGEWRWRLRAANGRIVADSGEGYVERHDCLHGIELVKRAANAPVEEGQ